MTDSSKPMSTDSKGARIESAELERLLKECTPGEWHLDAESNAEVPSGTDVFATEDHCIDELLATAYEMNRRGGRHKSNAELIALAPDLAREVLELRQAAAEVRRSALLEAEQEKWISVEDRLPDNGGLPDPASDKVLVLLHDPHKGWQHREHAAFFDYSLGEWNVEELGYTNAVTHWQPLPAPPAERKE